MNQSFFTPQPSQIKVEVTREPACGFPYSCFFSGMQDYRAGQLTRIQVQVLEYLLFMCEYHLRGGKTEFWHPYEAIAKEVWLAQDTVRDAVDKLKELGFLRVRQTRPRGQFVSTFTIRYLAIAKNIHVLFGKPGKKTKLQYLRIRQRRIALVRMHVLKLRNQQQRYS